MSGEDAKGAAPSGDAAKGPEAAEEGEEALAAAMAKMLLSPAAGPSENVQRVDSLDLAGIAKFIKDGHATSIITMAGAGISTAAGIPDFRSPGTGLYDCLQEYDLPDPMAIFSLDYFREQPEPFFKVSKSFYGDYKPTVTHCFLRLLHDKGLLLRHFTQNIDMLEEKAGLPEEQIVYAHGNYRKSHCIECGKEYGLEWMVDLIQADKLPKCEDSECAGLVKPDIVFFGESLPPRFARRAVEDFPAADLLVVLGTSLVVMPFASLVDRVATDVPRLYINREMNTGGDNIMLALLGISQGLRCDAEDNYRDVFAKGDCDDVCRQLAALLGWKDELEKLHLAGQQPAKAPPKGTPAAAASKGATAAPPRGPQATGTSKGAASPPKGPQAAKGTKSPPRGPQAAVTKGPASPPRGPQTAVTKGPASPKK